MKNMVVGSTHQSQGALSSVTAKIDDANQDKVTRKGSGRQLASTQSSNRPNEDGSVARDPLQAVLADAALNLAALTGEGEAEGESAAAEQLGVILTLFDYLNIRDGLFELSGESEAPSHTQGPSGGAPACGSIDASV